MSRKSNLSVLVLLPWWFSAILAGISFIALSILASRPADGTFLWEIIRSIAPAAKTLIPSLFCVVSLISSLRSWKIKATLNSQSGTDSLVERHWKEFEDLIGEVFRRQGYSVEESLGGGPDGGIDLVLRRSGKTTLVQCKRWQRRAVGVTTVRELFGVMASEHAQAGILVSTSAFTQEAHAFAAGKQLRLIDGTELTTLIKSVQPHAPVDAIPHAPATSSCPRCGSVLILRIASKGANAGGKFLGCSAFPRCRHTQTV